MLIRNIRRSLAVAVASGALLLVSAMPAQASSVSTFCLTNNIWGQQLSLDGVAFYYTDGAYHVWNEFDFLLDGAGTGGESNALIRFYDNGPEVWNWESGDNIDSYVWYGVGANIWVLASHSERAWFKAIFDNAGPDPRCSNSTPTI